MVNPGAFHGARKAFLMGEKEAYSQAVDEGYAAECIAKIQRRFFKRFPIDLPDEAEPTAEELAKVDDDEIEPDFPEPERDKMSQQEYEAALDVLEERRKKLVFKKGVSICFQKVGRSVCGMPVVYSGTLVTDDLLTAD